MPPTGTVVRLTPEVDMNSKAPERVWANMSGSLPSWLFGNTRISTRPFVSVLMLSAASLIRTAPGWSTGKAVPYLSLYSAGCAKASFVGAMDKTPAPAAAPQNVRRERVTAASLFRPVGCRLAEWGRFFCAPSLQHSARRQPIELNEAERIASALISEQHEETAYCFPEGRIPGFTSCRALRRLRLPARSQSRYLR